MIGIFQEKLPFLEKVKDLLTMILFASFSIFASDIQGMYYMVGLIVAIFAIHLALHSGKVHFCFDIMHFAMFFFGVYCLISALWAHNPVNPISKGITILSLLVAFSLLYVSYYKCSVERLVNIVMWGGFILSVYSINFYGLDTISETLDSFDRLDNSFANINVIGMAASISVISGVYFWRQNKNKMLLLFCVPAIVMVAGSGSRKALLMLVLGVLYLVMKQNTSGSTNNLKRFGAIFASLIALCVIGYFAMQLGIFGGAMDRMDGFIASLTGKGEVDHSTYIRGVMRQIGWNQFFKTPIFGMGIDNPYLLAMRYVGRDCYLHCNYAELAAGGGVVGLAIYYIPLFYILRQEVKHLKDNKLSVIIVLFLLLQLVMDYGAVSYYSKSTYFNLMIYSLHLQELKRNGVNKRCC